MKLNYIHLVSLRRLISVERQDKMLVNLAVHGSHWYHCTCALAVWTFWISNDFEKRTTKWIRLCLIINHFSIIRYEWSNLLKWSSSTVRWSTVLKLIANGNNVIDYPEYPLLSIQFWEERKWEKICCSNLLSFSKGNSDPFMPLCIIRSESGQCQRKSIRWLSQSYPNNYIYVIHSHYYFIKGIYASLCNTQVKFLD